MKYLFARFDLDVQFLYFVKDNDRCSALLMDCCFSLWIDSLNTHQVISSSNSLFINVKAVVKL